MKTCIYYFIIYGEILCLSLSGNDVYIIGKQAHSWTLIQTRE